MLKNKNAIITGSNRGIGKSILEKFAENGCNIWACARKKNIEFENFINKISKKYNVFIKPIYFDLTNSEELKNAFKNIYNEKLPIDILVNNAGLGHSELFQMTPISKFKEIFDINFFPMVELTQFVLKVMTRQKSGTIINFSSISAIDAYPAHCAYASSKAAILSFSRSLASELGIYGIRVNAIAPGPTETEMISIFEEKADGKMLNNIALNRKAKPNEIADVVMFLASDNSSYLNGQVIRVDGGSR